MLNFFNFRLPLYCVRYFSFRLLITCFSSSLLSFFYYFLHVKFLFLHFSFFSFFFILFVSLTYISVFFLSEFFYLTFFYFFCHFFWNDFLLCFLLFSIFPSPIFFSILVEGYDRFVIKSNEAQ